MAFTAQTKSTCWKQHTCVSCGSLFRYLITRQGSGQAADSEGATAAASRDLARVLAQDVDPHPCPNCGTYQPEMVGSLRLQGHRRLGWLALIGLPLLYAAALLVFGLRFWSWFGLAAAALLFVLSLRSARIDLNTKLNDNLAKAKAEVASGKLVLDQPGRGTARAASASPLTGSHKVALAMLAAGGVALALPEVIRLAAAWPLNLGIEPPVAGPGDTIRIDLPDRINGAIGSHWRGNATSRLVNAQELGVATADLKASSREDDYGSTIQVSKREGNTRVPVWIRVALPLDASLAGKTVTLENKLAVSFPYRQGSGFSNANAQFTRTISVALAGPHAGAVFSGLWWLGTIGGPLLILIGVYGLGRLAEGSIKQGGPTKLFPAR